MTAAHRLYLLGIIAENAVLPWVSSGAGFHSDVRPLQNGAAATTVIAGEINATHILDPGAALKSIAQQVRNTQTEPQAYLTAVQAADAGAKAVTRSFYLLRNSLFLLFVPLEYLNGFGPPDGSYKDFKDGCVNFSKNISGILRGAVADNWLGEAAEKYKVHTGLQQVRVDKMANADGRVMELLRTQATAVESGRQQLAAVRLAVTGGIAVAAVMMTTYFRTQRVALTGNYAAYQKAVALANAVVGFVYVLLAGVTADAIYVITTLSIQGTQTSNRIHNVIADGYQWVADDWHKNTPTGGVVDIGGGAT